MTRERFARLVEEALQDIPLRFRAAVQNLAVVVEDTPPPHVLEEMAIEPPDTLFGLYEGTPLPDRGSSYGNTLPDRISIYQRPIEEACAEEARETGIPAASEEGDQAIRICIAETVMHELGHYFGMSEEEIEEIEDKYWRGEIE
jgi:predicted Zn-dependent protease with MMP-like domain